MAKKKVKKAGKRTAKAPAKKRTGTSPRNAKKSAKKKAVKSVGKKAATADKPRGKKAPPKKGSKKATAAKPKRSATKSKSVARSDSERSSKRLAEGDSVPSFSLPDQDDTMVSSAELEGSPYVLYFYPKDDTPGCTREACGFRDEIEAFGRAGVRVVGVSPDSPASHRRFREKYGLTFSLLSDAERDLAKSFGSWVKKQNYGREYMGIERSTFLVGPDGRIQKVWRNVKVDGHVDKVLDAASEYA